MPDAPLATRAPFGLPVLPEAVPLSSAAMRLVASGVRALWARIEAADAGANHRPLLLSYDVHPTPDGPVLIEVNTNAGGFLTALEAARQGNDCCAEWEQGAFRERLLALFRRDLIGERPGVVAIVDDALASQALLPEMAAIAELLRPVCEQVLLVDAAELRFASGRLRHGGTAIDAVYWRSTDFLLADPAHAPVRQALAADSIALAPSPEAYRAIADKRRFLDWASEPVLAQDAQTGACFRIAQTVPMESRELEDWYAERAGWVFKPVSGHASRGVYVGKSISRARLAELPRRDYLAQAYTPHPVIDRAGRPWKYDVRFFADRGTLIGAAARVFQGQVVGMRTPGSGFAPVQVGTACCLLGALARAS